MDPYTLEQLDSSEPQGFHAIMRFLRVVNRHRMILIGLVAAAAFLAVVRHNRIPKQYEATAKLMITQTSTDPKAQSAKAVEGTLSSYKQLLLSDTVLKETVREMASLPKELTSQPDKSLWPITLRQMLTVTFETNQNVLQIKCRSVGAESTVSTIEALTTASSKFMAEYQKNITVELMNQLEANRVEVEDRLLEGEGRLLQARRDCGDIAINEGTGDQHPLLQRVSHLNGQLTSIRSKRLELESTLASARNLVVQGADITSALQKLESIVGQKVMSRIPGSAAGDAETIVKKKAELQVMESELTALRRHFGSGHSDIIRRQTQIQAQRQSIAEFQYQQEQQLSVGVRDPRVGQWLITTLDSELQGTRQYEHSLQNEYSKAEFEAQQLSDKLAGIQVAASKVETLREQHRSLLNRLNSINIEHGNATFKVAPLSDPMVPRNPTYPVLTSIMAIFCIVAAAIGLGVIYVIDLLDDRLRSPEEVREELGIPVVGIIRKLPHEEVEQSTIYVHSFPQTPHAECFRTLKTSLTLSPSETKCLAITSTEASEGKTTTTVNLAASYAQTGIRTLLIDADMRRPGLSRLLEVRGNGGLSEVLRAESDIPQLCRERTVPTVVPLLDILPCGPRILNAGMLLSMPTLADVLDWAVAEYDQVIVDCPPTLPVSDAAIVGRFVDGLLFLMNPDKTHRRSVTRAIDQLRSMGLKIVGIVANTSLSEDKNSYGYQYGYGYGYSTDYSYGHDDELDHDETDGVLPEADENSFGKAA